MVLAPVLPSSKWDVFQILVIMPVQGAWILEEFMLAFEAAFALEALVFDVTLIFQELFLIGQELLLIGLLVFEDFLFSEKLGLSIWRWRGGTFCAV